MDDLRIVMRRLKFAIIGALLLAAGVQFAHQDNSEFSAAATRSPRMEAQRSGGAGPKVDFTSVGVARPRRAAHRKTTRPPDTDAN